MLGKIVKGKVIDKNDDSYFVQVDGVTYELKKKEVTQDKYPNIGEIVQGFIYDNKHHKREMTQFLPFAQADQYGWSKVTQVKGDLGVFVDIGLPDKDVVVSLDDLPFDKSKWPRIDDKLLVNLETDSKDRIWAKLADENVFDQLASRFPRDIVNKNISGTVYSSRDIGAFVITNEYYLGFIHQSQMMRPLHVGEQFKGRVIGISKYGRLNLSVLPRSFEEISDDAQMILVSLQRQANKSLPFSDKSDAADIKQHFGISKSAFKRALGNLLKQNLIIEDKINNQISLVDNNETK